MSAAPPPGVDLLLEREYELRCIDAAIAAAREGSGRSVVIEGPAGIGKSAVLAAARIAGEDGATRFLRARGAELERDFAFGVVRQLFEPLLHEASAAERADLLQGPARLAARVLGLPGALEDGEAPAAAPDASFAVLHGLYWLCANLAASQLVVLSVDDAHWADASSLRFLAFLMPRLQELRIALIVATRPEADVEEAHLLATLTADPHADVVQPAPLSVAAVRRLVEARLGAAPDEAFTAACHRATGGVPFLVRELVEAVSREGMTPDARAAVRVEEVGASTARRWIQVRLGRLPAPAARLARAVAVLERAQLPSAAALAELDPAQAAEAADTLVAAGILEPERPLAFVHPLVRAGVYEELGVAERSLAHRRAAELMDDDPAGEERAAEHLLATEPAGDVSIARRLVDAARTAARRGAPESAAVLLRRALAEPPPPTERPGLLLELGIAEATAGQPAGEDHLREALDVAGDDHGVALGATLVLAHALGRAERIKDAVAVVDRTAARLRTTDEQTAELLETLALMAGMLEVSTAPALDTRLKALRRRADEPGATRRCSPRRPCERSPPRTSRPRSGSRWRAARSPPARGPCRRRPTCRGSCRRRSRSCGPMPSTRPSVRSRPAWSRAARPATARLRHEHDLAGVAAAAPGRPAGRRGRRAHGARGIRFPAPQLYRTVATGVCHGGADPPGRPRGCRGRAAAVRTRPAGPGRTARDAAPGARAPARGTAPARRSPGRYAVRRRHRRAHRGDLTLLAGVALGGGARLDGARRA